MRYRIFPIIITLVIIAIGYVVKRKTISDYQNRLKITDTFREKFIDLVDNYTQHYQIDSARTVEIAQELDMIQQELGFEGVIAHFHDPISGLSCSNYPLFLNILKEMRTMQPFLDSEFGRNRIWQLLSLCDDALLRHIGNLNHLMKSETSSLLNPFSCFGEGIRWLIGLPGQFLVWLGIMKPYRMKSVQGNMLFKVMSGIVTLVGFLGSIITILLGWEETLVLLNKLLQR